MLAGRMAFHPLSARRKSGLRLKKGAEMTLGMVVRDDFYNRIVFNYDYIMVLTVIHKVYRASCQRVFFAEISGN